MAIGITTKGTKSTKDERANLKIQVLKVTNRLRSVDELLKEMMEVYKNDKATEKNTSN